MADAAGKDDMVESADSRGHGRDGLRDPDCEELHGELGLRAGIGKQHAHVAMPGDSGKACTAVQAIFKRLRIQAFMPQQIQQRAGIEIYGAGRARDSTQRSESNGGVAAAAVLDGSDAASTLQMREAGATLTESRAGAGDYNWEEGLF